jgi:ribonuclease HII
MRGHDRDLRLALGPGLLCGVDEAGRGPLAGPVTAAAVILPPDWHLPGLDDSKRLDAARRALLETGILEQALAWAVAEASVEEIDRLNILRATFLAMGRAVEQLVPAPDFLLVDGRDFPFANRRGRSLVHGDGISACVAAASILAKQARDRRMERAALEWPAYGFERHKGYGTAFHLQALRDAGPCPLHRRSFSPVRQLLWGEEVDGRDGQDGQDGRGVV